MAAISSSRLVVWNISLSEAISVSVWVSSESPRFSSSSKKPGRMAMRAGARAEVGSGGDALSLPASRAVSSSCT
ncbi:hypothetical protein D3C86_1611770 [compost metagenome]